MSMIFALMLAAAQPAPTATPPAPDWRPLGIAQEHYRLAWDAASIERGSEMVRVTVRSEAAQSPETSSHMVSRVEIRCAVSTARVVETITYAADGSVVNRDTAPAAFAVIPPGSHIASIKQAVC